MLVSALLFSVLAYISLAEVTTIYHAGQFSGLLYESALSKKESVSTLSFAYPASACVSTFSVEATEKASASVETIARHNQGVYVWEELGRTEIVNGHGVIALSEPRCASRFRIVLSNGDFKDLTSDAEEVAITKPTGKREVSCVGQVGTWPKGCGTAPEGQKCLADAFCGCSRDADCYGNSVLPYCNNISGVCASCFAVQRSGVDGNGNTRTNFSSHYFCRSRYPTVYLTDSTFSPRPDITKMLSIAGERTPDIVEQTTNPDDFLGGYFREICSNISPDPSVSQNIATLGSCERCNQAAYLADIWLPKYNFVATATNPQPNEGPKGTYFCQFIRGNSVAGINSMNLLPSQNPTPMRPICSTQEYFSAVGLGNLWFNLTCTEELLSYGDENGNNAVPYVEKNNYMITRTLDQWEGACVPCLLNHPDGTKKAYHGLCSYALAYNNVSGQDLKISTPICSSTTGGCNSCGSNADCQLGNSSDPAFTTGGPNCMTAGYCIFCLVDSDCVGDLGNDPVCGTDGVCKARILCDGNNNDNTPNKCATSTSPNCYTDGTCRDCRLAGNGCGTPDLNDNQICDQTTGICRGCTLNADCTGLGNALNCYADGVCRDCLTYSCGTTDGGQPGASPSGCSGPVAGSQYCADKSGQPLCNSYTHRCEDICNSNDYCGARTNAIGVGGGGANCQLDGTCLSCSPVGGSASSPAATCGVLDGPQVGLANRVGNNGETDCGTSGICYNDVKCTTNSNCTTIGGGNNCQVTGGCISCTVTYSSTTCSSNDGGEVANQPNCNLASRLCVGGCSTEADCVGTQGANCMANQVCFDCRSNADCMTGNAWGGDRIGRTLCVNTLCTYACDANYNAGGSHPCGSDTPNCNSDGTCVRCTTDSGCASSDGPPSTSKVNTVCDPSGVCVDPWLCTNGGAGGSNADNAGCQAHYGDSNHQNCNLDGTCTNCVDNAGCQANDGGLVPYQPRCDPSSHVCTGCLSNADCPASRANCQNDGSCQDCRNQTSANGKCANDGPPGLGSNRNCDPLTGICVDFCVEDGDCTDACKPRCQIERGCCVECIGDSDCPVAQWRGSEKAGKTRCDTNWGYQCVPPITCQIDEDCGSLSTSQSLPACAQGQDICVECTADVHCSNRPGKACAVGRQKCVVCTSDAHCLDVNTVCDVRTNYCVWSSSVAMTASLFLSLVMIFVSFF